MDVDKITIDDGSVFQGQISCLKNFDFLTMNTSIFQILLNFYF